ncbi:hypothetical protein PQR33_32920 [Paraburkholderia sediminicola]|uniref:hypothetical protein n=1 Tax=Paraburkholderia sediminicola TaxID=458836 RepID=UPI0038B8DCB0
MKPLHVMVLVVNVLVPTRYTVVVALIEMRTVGVFNAACWPVAKDATRNWYAPLFPVGCVADVVLMPARKATGTVVPAGMKVTVPDTSQSPAVKLMLVQFDGAAVVSDVPAVAFVPYSPTLPVAALLPLVTPTIFGVVIVGELEVIAFASTNAVVAICVVFVPTVAVGAVGVPVSAGEASRA